VVVYLLGASFIKYDFLLPKSTKKIYQTIPPQKKSTIFFKKWRLQTTKSTQHHLDVMYVRVQQMGVGMVGDI
jgi:hypothetical protein